MIAATRIGLAFCSLAILCACGDEPGDGDAGVEASMGSDVGVGVDVGDITADADIGGDGDGVFVETDEPPPGPFGVDAVTPSVLGPAGGTVIISGTGLHQIAAVAVRDLHFGVTDLTSTEATIEVPPMPVGPAPITLTLVDGRVASLPDALTIRVLPLEFVAAPSDWLPDPGVGVVRDGAGVDLDLDGAADLVVAGELGLVVLAGDGRSGFELPDELMVAEVSMRAVAVGDLDGDGNDDLVACSDRGTIAVALAGRAEILLGEIEGAVDNEGSGDIDGAGAPEEPAVGPACVDMVVSDLDGDGENEAVELTETGRVRVWGLVGFAVRSLADERPAGLSDGGSALAAGDLDGDGDDELLIAVDGGLTLVWVDAALSGGAARWSVEERVAGVSSVQALAILDVDADDDADIFAAVDGRQDRLFVNDGAGRYSDATIVALPIDDSRASGVAAADLDVDGAVDIVVGVPDGFDRLYQGRDGGFADRTPALGFHDVSTAVPVLIDADGDRDLDVILIPVEGRPRLLANISSEQGR